MNPVSLSGGGIAEKASAIFRVYDQGNRNFLDHESMMAALAELGVLNGMTVRRLCESMPA